MLDLGALFKQQAEGLMRNRNTPFSPIQVNKSYKCETESWMQTVSIHRSPFNSDGHGLS